MISRLPDQKKLVPISEAAKFLGISIDTVRRWDKSGILHSERIDGKNRYFSLSGLEQHKLHQPLTISEVAKKLSISPTTLRRLEARGIIIPQRNNAGERLYDKNLLENFLKSDYCLRRTQITDIKPEQSQKEKESEETHSSNQAIDPNPKLKHRSRIPEFLTLSTIMFLILVALGVRNIQIFAISLAKNSKPISTQAVLSETQETTPTDGLEVNPEATPEAKLQETPETQLEATPEAKLETILMVQTNDESSTINIRQKPSVNSKKIGKAKNGDIFEFVSIDSGWFEIKLANGSTGFILAEYIVWKEININE